MKNSRHPQYSSPLLINSWTAATQSLLLNQSLVDLYYILNYTVNFYWYKYIRHLRHSVNSLWVSGNRKEWRNDNGKYEKKGKDNDAYYMNKPGTIWVILSSPSLCFYLDEWCNGLWAAMGLLCQSGHLRILLRSQFGFGCVERVGFVCACVYLFFFILFCLFFYSFCQYAFFPLSVTDDFLSLVYMC